MSFSARRIARRIALRYGRGMPTEQSTTAPTLWDIVDAAIEAAVREVKADRREEARERYEIRQAAADPNAEGIEPPPLPPVAAAAELAWYESDARAVAHATVRRLIRHLTAPEATS